LIYKKKVTVKVLLNSGVMRFVMGSEFVRKQEFKLKKIKRLIYIRNVDGSFNKEEPIEYIVEVNIYYQRHRKRTKINVIGGQKWSIILRILWLVCYNPEIDWKTKEVKIIKYPEEYER